jgi:hypothetical protein
VSYVCNLLMAPNSLVEHCRMFTTYSQLQTPQSSGVVCLQLTHGAKLFGRALSYVCNLLTDPNSPVERCRMFATYSQLQTPQSSGVVCLQHTHRSKTPQSSTVVQKSNSQRTNQILFCIAQGRGTADYRFSSVAAPTEGEILYPL